jgi:hypothetical protein
MVVTIGSFRPDEYIAGITNGCIQLNACICRNIVHRQRSAGKILGPQLRLKLCFRERSIFHVVHRSQCAIHPVGRRRDQRDAKRWVEQYPLPPARLGMEPTAFRTPSARRCAGARPLPGSGGMAGAVSCSTIFRPHRKQQPIRDSMAVLISCRPIRLRWVFDTQVQPGTPGQSSDVLRFTMIGRPPVHIFPRLNPPVERSRRPAPWSRTARTGRREAAGKASP